MDGKLCPGIQLPLEIFTPSFRESPPHFNLEIFQPPFLKFRLESQKTGGGHYV